MAKVTNIRRIKAEDFEQDDQALISKLATVLNPLMDELQIVFNKGIDFQNLNQQLASFVTEVDNNGKPKVTLQLRYDLVTPLKGILCISVDGDEPTGTPFVSYNIVAGVINITKIAGISPNKKIRLSLILIG